MSVYLYASLCDFVCIALLLPFLLGFCLSVVVCLFIYLFFGTVFSTCYNWFLGLVARFFLLFITFLSLIFFILITFFSFLSSFLSFLPSFFLSFFFLSFFPSFCFFPPFSSEPCGWQCLSVLARCQAWASEVGGPSSRHWSTRDPRSQVISNSESSLRDLHLNAKTQLHSKARKLQCWTPYAQ